MEVRSIYKHARISPKKARDVAREIQGLAVSDAIDALNFTPRKAAFLIGKTLKSAVANAENNHELSADSLVVKEANVSSGPTFRRYKPRARGSASPIIKRTSHIYIILSDEIEIEKKPGRDRKKAAKPAAPKEARSEAKPAATEEAPPAEELAGETVEESVEESAGETRQDERFGLVFTDAPSETDDLKKIEGVGQVIEDKLNEVGIFLYAQIANWSEDEIAAFDEVLDLKGRIERDDWLAQAVGRYEEKYGSA